MPEQKQDVTMWVGDTRTLVIDIRNKDGSVPNMTVASAIRWWMGRNAHSTGADIFVQKSLTNGITISNTPGQIMVAIAEADTLNIEPCVPPGYYYHEVEVRMASAVSTVTIGKFILQPAIIPGLT